MLVLTHIITIAQFKSYNTIYVIVEKIKSILYINYYYKSFQIEKYNTQLKSSERDVVYGK